MGRLRLPWPVPRSGRAGRAAPRGTLFSCRLLRCWIAFRPSCLTAQILKELSVWLEQHSCVFSGKALLIGLDRSVESEEIAITIEGGGKNGIALGVAVAANLFGLGVRLCDEDGYFAISARGSPERARFQEHGIPQPRAGVQSPADKRPGCFGPADRLFGCASPTQLCPCQ